MNYPVYPIIGMSPGNSYFKDQEIAYLLQKMVEGYGRVAILIADIPAIATYKALGYPENIARRDKAIPKGNALKNRVRKKAKELGYDERSVRIIEWGRDIESQPHFQRYFEQVVRLYRENQSFHMSAFETTQSVLQASKKEISDLEAATEIAVHYLLCELAFLEFAPKFLETGKVAYVYHRNWPVYEDYIAGRFDGKIRKELDFILLENPYETYNPIWATDMDGEEACTWDVLERVRKSGILRVGFIHSVPTFMYDRDYDNFSGIFYEIIILIAKKFSWKLRWTEETGYGVIADGLAQDRFDIFGSTVWPTPERREKATFSRSLFMSPVFTWTQGSDPRSEEFLKTDVNARVAVKENDISHSIACADFCNTRRVNVPQLSDNIATARLVADGRADFTFFESYLAEYLWHTEKIHLIKASQVPIRVYENTFIMKQGEQNFKAFLDQEIDLLEQNGEIKRLIKKYTGSENTFFDADWLTESQKLVLRSSDENIPNLSCQMKK